MYLRKERVDSLKKGTDYQKPREGTRPENREDLRPRPTLSKVSGLWSSKHIL